MNPVLVIGAEYGHGKRSNVPSDFTFAVRDEQTVAEIDTLQTSRKLLNRLEKARASSTSAHA